MCVLVVARPAAWADEPLYETPRVEARGVLVEDGPLLELDPALGTQLEGLGAVEDSERTAIRLDPRTLLTVEGSWWSNDDNDRDGRPALDVAGRGWRAGARLSRDLGFATLEVNGLISQTELEHLTMVEPGKVVAFDSVPYVDIGVALTRRFRLSRWMQAWISLGINHRIWLRESPTGEAGGTTVGLSIGTTFR
jgi:hypothetical protein